MVPQITILLANQKHYLTCCNAIKVTQTTIYVVKNVMFEITTMVTPLEKINRFIIHEPLTAVHDKDNV